MVANPQLYDTNFNQTDDGANYKFVYDANDQLQTVTTRGAMPTTVATYRYDAFGRRVEKNVGGTITRYYYAGQQIVEEHDAADAVQAFYTYGTYIDEPLTMDRAGSRYYYHANRPVRSTYLLTDATSAIAERCSYTAYGARHHAQRRTRRRNRPRASTAPYLFTGRELDGEAACYATNRASARMTRSRGGFKQLDPAGYEAAEFSLFLYVRDGPAEGIDPSGLRLFGSVMIGSNPEQGAVFAAGMPTYMAKGSQRRYLEVGIGPPKSRRAAECPFQLSSSFLIKRSVNAKISLLYRLFTGRMPTAVISSQLGHSKEFRPDGDGTLILSKKLIAPFYGAETWARADALDIGRTGQLGIGPLGRISKGGGSSNNPSAG